MPTPTLPMAPLEAKASATRWDSLVLAGGGGLLIALALIFGWNELQVPLEVVPGLAAIVGAALALVQPKRVGPLGPALLGVAAVAGGLAWVLTRSVWTLPGLAVALVGAALAVVRDRNSAVTPEERLDSAIRWHTLATAIVATTAAFYFEFFTLGFAADEVARRLVPTLLWAILGTVFVVRARTQERPAMRDAGFVLVAFAAGKALLYDTTHLDGGLRVLCLAVVGALMLVGGVLVNRKQEAR